MFFAEAQNKLLYAVTGNTAAEIVMQRADETLPNMGLMTWKGSVVRKGDVIIAKNYLVKDEIDKLNRLVMLFLESAELRVKERKDLTLDYWRSNVDALLTFQGQAVLKGNGQVSNGEMEAYAKEVYCRFDERRKKMDAQNADEEDLRFLENLENEIKNKKSESMDLSRHLILLNGQPKTGTFAVGLKELSRRWWRFGIKELSLQHIKIRRYE